MYMNNTVFNEDLNVGDSVIYKNESYLIDKIENDIYFLRNNEKEIKVKSNEKIYIKIC